MAINIVLTIIYSALVGASILAIVSSLFRSALSPPRNNYLTGLFTLVLIHALGELLIVSGGYQYAPHLAGAQLPIRMLLGPALFLYASSMMSSKPIKVIPTFGIALLGPVAIIVIMLPFAGLSAEQKLALADPAARDPALYHLAVAICAASATIFVSFIGAYLIATIRLQNQHRKRMMAQYANIETRSLDWLRYTLVLWGIAWLLFAADIALWTLNIHWAALGVILALLETLALIAFAQLALNQPPMPAPSQVNSESETATGRVPALPADRMARIADKLAIKMREDQLFTDNDLSLRHLADATGSSENHLSETFSQHLRTNFFQFVNEYRIDEAKRLLETTDDSITHIAFAVGFNSRSTFNTAFKKDTGQTPSAFRAQKKSLPSANQQ